MFTPSKFLKARIDESLNEWKDVKGLFTLKLTYPEYEELRAIKEYLRINGYKVYNDKTICGGEYARELYIRRI